MGEAVADLPGKKPPVRLDRRQVQRLGVPRRLFRPAGGRNLHHAAEKPALGASAKEHRAVRPHRPERRAVTRRTDRLRRSLGQPFRDARARRRAVFGQRAAPAVGRTGRADGRAEIHHRLGVVARPPVGREPVGEPVERGLRAGQRILHREEPRDDAFHVAVDDGGAAVERDRGDGGGGIGADARKRAQPRPRCPENARRGPRPESARICGDCGPGRSSRAPAIHSAPRRDSLLRARESVGHLARNRRK